MAQVAGHPIAIRVGGRRMSQSNPVRSPTKSHTSTSLTADKDNETPAAEPDYPRPRSPAKATTAADDHAAENAAASDDAAQDDGQGNRQERRRQERRREKNREHQDNGALSRQNDAMFDHLRKGSLNGGNHARQSNAGANGVRICQPAQKVMFK